MHKNKAFMDMLLVRRSFPVFLKQGLGPQKFEGALGVQMLFGYFLKVHLIYIYISI
jgi:hypothetical protein